MIEIRRTSLWSAANPLKDTSCEDCVERRDDASAWRGCTWAWADDDDGLEEILLTIGKDYGGEFVVSSTSDGWIVEIYDDYRE